MLLCKPYVVELMQDAALEHLTRTAHHTHSFALAVNEELTVTLINLDRVLAETSFASFLLQLVFFYVFRLLMGLFFAYL